MSSYAPALVLAFVALCLIGIALILIVIRAKKDDLPTIARAIVDIVRALTRVEPRDSDGGKARRRYPSPEPGVAPKSWMVT
jgi:hypothetical protein